MCSWFSVLHLDESDANPGPVSRKTNIRALALAIVPGQHIQSIAVAKQFISQTSSVGDKRPAEPDSNARLLDMDATQEGNGLTEKEEAGSGDRTPLSCTTVPD